MSNPTILILTQAEDAHAPPVEKVLCRYGADVVRFDLNDFPERIQLAAQMNEAGGWYGSIAYQGQKRKLEDIQSIWCRRPRQYRAPQEYTPPVREFLDRETYRGFLGVLLDTSSSEHSPFWVSRRDRIQAAEFKPAQLRTAQALGLHIPRTLITNDPPAVTSFYDECQGKMIAKAVSKGVLDPDGQYMPGQPRFLHTNIVQPQHLVHLTGVQTTAHLFQELVPKALELRVVVIGRQVFAVEIYSQKSERTCVDWRRYYPDLEYGVHTLPSEIEQKVLQLVRAFHLQFSSADFIVTPDGEYYFVELNPTGQFYWLEPPTGLPMAEAMAHLLLYPQEYGIR